MLMRTIVAVLCPLLLCLVTCVLYRWLDGLLAQGGFFLFLLKGILLGVCVALLLPLAGISARNNGLIRLLYVAAGLLLLFLVYQYLETVGAVHWPALKAIISINGQVILIEGTVMGYLALTAFLNRKRRSGAAQ